MVHLTHLTAALSSLPFLFAHPADILSREDRGGCGTEAPPTEFLAAAAEIASVNAAGFSSFTASSQRVAPVGSPSYPITVKTWIHVVAASEALIDGWIPENQLLDQMDVLNDNFAPQKIFFQLEGITRTVNANWSIDTTGSELQMKTALRKGDYKTLNLYFQKRLRQDALGYAYYPTTVTKGSAAFYRDGATNRYDTVPGGTATNYNLGKTVTHEVGHWLGLMHTFEGYSCTGPGDYVADTAIHNAPTSGCPIGLDTCPDGEGPDPIHNYMDYSIDACYEEFTPLQTKRMFDMWNMFRDINKCSADNCLRSLRASTIPGRLEESQAFCGEFTKTFVSDVEVVPKYAVEACPASIVVSRVSSACACLPTA